MAMPAIYLNEADREVVIKFAKMGTNSSHLIIRAKILLILDKTGKKDYMRIKRTAEAHGITVLLYTYILKNSGKSEMFG